MTGLDRSGALQEVKTHRFQDSRNMQVLRLSDLFIGRLYPAGTHFSQRLSRAQAGSIMLMKNSNGTIRNRTRDLPTCSAVPQPTAPQGVSGQGYQICVTPKAEFPRIKKNVSKEY